MRGVFESMTTVFRARLFSVLYKSATFLGRFRGSQRNVRAPGPFVLLVRGVGFEPTKAFATGS